MSINAADDKYILPVTLSKTTTVTSESLNICGYSFNMYSKAVNKHACEAFGV